MSGHAWLEVAVLGVLLTALALPLGEFIARLMRGEESGLGWLVGPLERLCLRLAGVAPDQEMGAGRYAAALLAFNGTGFAWLYALQRLQGLLPFNPEAREAVPPGIALNTAVSFVTNTNWQAYSGEASLSLLTQMLGLGVQNFLSAASGIAVLFALVRGLSRRESRTVGSFWVDLVRITLHLLLPLSVAFALLLVSQGVVQTLAGHVDAALIEPQPLADGSLRTLQRLALGPVASQVAIKQLGTNGGGFFNANGAHPFENPSPATNVFEGLAILLIPAALCFAFGAAIRDRKQGFALYAAMALLLLPPLVLTVGEEERGALVGEGHRAGPNLEGKEVRFGPIDTALWATATTAASNGSVNGSHDALTPLGGLGPLWLMVLGEVAFGGVGSGLYGLLVFALIAVFVAGLMVGRTPEYLGKKVEPFEMKMAALAVLLPSAVALLGTAVASAIPEGFSVRGNPGAHGFSELLYAWVSAANDNGSAFGGLDATGSFWTLGLAFAMAVGRYGVALPVLALAGSLAAKRTVPAGPGTLPTHGPLFVLLLAAVVVLVGALTFLPALFLGPIAEHAQLAVHGVSP